MPYHASLLFGVHFKDQTNRRNNQIDRTKVNAETLPIQPQTDILPTPPKGPLPMILRGIEVREEGVNSTTGEKGGIADAEKLQLPA